MKLNPLTARKLRRFRSLKRGYYSFWLLIVLTALSLVAGTSRPVRAWKLEPLPGVT
jgi:ABC-type microcin C transport system permease subunit YejE